jgi:hypothetical protein
MDCHVVPFRIKDERRELGPVRVQEPATHNVAHVLVNFGVVGKVAFAASDAILYDGKGNEKAV